MSFRTTWVVTLSFLLLAPGAVFAGVIFEDDFESYADTTAMKAAGAWGDVSSSGNPGALDTVLGNPGQSMNHPGGATLKHIFPETTVTDAAPLVWEFDMYWDGAGNKRLSGGLRDNGVGPLAALLEMGYYNAAPEGSGWAYRTVFLPGSTDWHRFPVQAIASAQTWLHFKATIGETSILFEASGDLGSTSATVPANSAGITYDILRFGGPSDVSSTGGGGNFDNVRVSQVPEPATIALLGFGLAGLVAASRRRKA